MDANSTDTITAILRHLAPLLRSSTPTEEICASAPEGLLPLLQEPLALPALRVLTELSELRARILAAECLLDAISTLRRIIAKEPQDARHAETLRKSASAIIRLEADLRRAARVAPPPSSPPLTHAPSRMPPESPPRSSAPDVPQMTPLVSSSPAIHLRARAGATAPGVAHHGRIAGIALQIQGMPIPDQSKTAVRPPYDVDT